MSSKTSKAEQVTAFLVAEPLGMDTDFKKAGHSLAMAPIGNRPAIDYAIENLIRNGIYKIFILSSSADFKSTKKHVGKYWTHDKRGGVSSTVASPVGDQESNSSFPDAGAVEADRAERIEVRECPLGKGCFDVLAYIQKHNLVRDGHYFMIVPLDTISNISNLSCLVDRAVQRHTRDNLILTAVVARDDQGLRSLYGTAMAYEAALRRPKGTLNAPDCDFMEETALAPRHTIGFDPATGMLQAFKEWKPRAADEDDDDEGGGDSKPVYPPMPPIEIKRNGAARVCVRTDLMLTGIIISSTDVFNVAINTYQRSVSDFVNEFIACQIEWNIDIAIDVANAGATVCPLTSRAALLSANRRVAARSLHPMTRDANFGNAVALKYAPSYRSPLICVPETEGCPALVGTIDGSGVFGLGTGAHESSYITNSFLFDGCTVGEDAVIVNSVLGRNVTVDKGVVITNSFVPDNSHVTESVRDAIFGAEEEENDSDDSDSDEESGFDPKIISTYDLISSDKIYVEGDDDDDNGAVNWRKTLWESYLNNPDVDANSVVMGLSEFRLSAHLTNQQLIQMMFEILITNTNAASKAMAEDAIDNWDFIKAEISRHLLAWDATFLWKFTYLNDDEGASYILRGLSIGMAKCPHLQPVAGKILNIFYGTLSEALFDKREFCIVSGPAIISFLEAQDAVVPIAKDSDDDEDDDGDDAYEDDLVNDGWAFFETFANKVKELFEEDSDDDDDDDDEDEDEDGDDE